MTLNIKHQIIIHALCIALSLCLELKTIIFKPYKNNNTKDLKFTSAFENVYLIESYITNDLGFSHMKCISKYSKNSLTQAISFEVGQDSERTCKSYSQSNFQLTDIFEFNKSMIFFTNKIVSKFHKNNCKYG